MPNYLFEEIETGRIVEVFQNMNDLHEYSENGVAFRRVWSIPGASIDSQADPFDTAKYVDKTYNQKMTLGNMWSASKELSEKRKDKLGYDPIKENYKKEYSEKRGGMKYIEGKGE